MRAALDRVYDGCAYAAGLFMILILIFTLLGVAGGIFDFYVRGTDAFAGYCMAAPSFLALAHTFRKGEHIRVTLILQLSGRPRRWRSLACLAVGALLAGAFAAYSVKMVWWSHAQRLGLQRSRRSGSPIGMALGGAASCCSRRHAG